VGSLAFEWTATSSEVRPVEVVANVAFSQGDADAPTVRVTGAAAFTWPCVPGAAIAFPATVDVRMGAFIVEGGAGDASLACGTKAQRAGAPKAAVSVAIGRVTVHGVVLTGVIVHAELFDDERGTGMIGSVEGEVEVAVAGGLGGQKRDMREREEYRKEMREKGEGHTPTSAIERAKQKDEDADEDEENWMTARPEEVNFYADSETFHFDSYTSAIRQTVALTYESEYLTLSLSVGTGIGGHCDHELGDQVSGHAILQADGVYAEGAVSGARHCGGSVAHVAHMREAGAEPVPVAPSYTKFVNEHIFPTSGADMDSACAVDGVCGEATGMVCAAGQYCDELTRMCSHVSPAKRIIDAADALRTAGGPNPMGDPDSTNSNNYSHSFYSNSNYSDYANFSNNFGGACSRCSADMMCGPDNGGTVCGRAHRCVNETGECVAVSSLNEPDDFATFLRDAGDPMFPFGNNHGGACPERECAVDKRCGPIYSFKVCAAGFECSFRGVCSAMDPSGELSDDADAEHSNNNFDACDAFNAACALTKLCGPTNGFKVCMSHELCVEGGCVEEAVFDTSSYKDVVPAAKYSNNFAGACFRCARGEGFECGGDATEGLGLVCPGELMCARHPVLVEGRRIAKLKAEPGGEGDFSLVMPRMPVDLPDTEFICVQPDVWEATEDPADRFEATVGRSS